MSKIEDRELLGLAAKAGGSIEFRLDPDGQPRVRAANGVAGPWNSLADAQYAAAKMAGGSPWLQGLLNLLLTDRPGALVLLLIDDLTAQHGREWLTGLVEKINERVKNV